MNIGVDFDGVIVDSEKHFKYQFEKLAFFRHGKEPHTRAWRSARKCFDLSQEEWEKIFKEIVVKVTENCPFMAGVEEVLDLLRKRGHKLFLVTARTDIYEGETESAQKRIAELGFKFDGEFWRLKDKAAACKENNITVMIEDCNSNARQLSENGIHTFYFREKGVEKLPASEYLVDVYNWMHIYKEILKLEETGKK